jgi:nucleotide-binding universal stress UspA family protein
MEIAKKMKIKKLLFVTKFEELGFDALQSLLLLVKADLNHVVFLNVIERDKVAFHRGVGYQKDEEIRLREKANIRFIDWAEHLFEQGMEVGVYIVVGNLVPQIIKAAQKEEADLVVIGRSQKGVLEQFYSGSDVTEVIRRTSTPILVFKHMADDIKILEKPFQNPLLAMDWSPASLRAVAYLKSLKDIIETIDIVTVASEKELSGKSAMGVQKTRKIRRQKLDTICEEFEALGLRARPHIYIGDPAEELERAAKECKASLVVLGSSGKGAWAEKWIGSIPRTISEKSVFPTLLIPPEIK